MLKKRIVFITPGIATGGAERQLALLAKSLSQDGFVPLIIALSQSEPGQRLADFDGLQILEINCRKLFSLASAIWRIRRAIMNHNPDFIQGWMYAGNILASIVGLGIGCKIFHSLRASNMDAGRYGLIMRINAVLSKYVDAVIANSDSGAEYHVANGFSSVNIIVIPNGIDVKKFFPDRQSGAILRSELGVEKKTRLVLYAARVDPMKDHEKVISIAKQCPDIYFVFVGKGTEFLSVPKNILALGVWDDMQKIYNACDWLLSISKFGEGFPNVIGEAMACGIPVLANDVGDSWQIIDATGYRLKSNDVGSLSVEFLKAVRAPVSEATKLDIRLRVTEQYSVDAMAARYIEEYLRV